MIQTIDWIAGSRVSIRSILDNMPDIIAVRLDTVLDNGGFADLTSFERYASGVGRQISMGVKYEKILHDIEEYFGNVAISY